MRLLLVRHGESEANAQGLLQGQAEFALTERGIEQARLVGVRLAREYPTLDALYASSLGRTIETARVIGAMVGLDPILDDRLREYDMGIVSGMHHREVRARYPDLGNFWLEERPADWRPVPGEEGGEAFHRRIRGAFAEIRARHRKDATVVIVSHGGTLRAFMCQTLHRDDYNGTQFRLSNVSLTVFDWNDQPSIRLYNDTTHLT